MILVKKLKFPRFLGNGLRYDSLWRSREKGALDYKKVILTQLKNMEYTHDFSQKSEISSKSAFFGRRLRYDASWCSRLKRRLSKL